MFACVFVMWHVRVFACVFVMWHVHVFACVFVMWHVHARTIKPDMSAIVISIDDKKHIVRGQ